MFDEHWFVVITFIAAWWGAGMSTLIVGWLFFKSRDKGTRLLLWLEPFTDGPGYSDDEPEDMVTVTVTNVGTRPTQIKSIRVEFYTNWLNKLLGRPDRFAEFEEPLTSSPLPKVVKPEEHWVCFLPHDDPAERFGLEELARTGYAMICVQYSNKGKEVRGRLKIGSD
jgi:hypothetical protein